MDPIAKIGWLLWLMLFYGTTQGNTLEFLLNGRESSKIQGINWIKERVFAKLEGCNSNLLNQAGKEVLIKAVVQDIPRYMMFIVRLPKTFCSSHYKKK